MRILGIDPGLKATGYGVVDVLNDVNHSTALLETGTVEPHSEDPLPVKIDKVYRNLNDIIIEHAPDVMVLEKLYAHYKHPTTACLLGHVRGVIVLLAARHHLQFVEHSVKRIRKALVGNGNATKQQTRDVVAHILGTKAKQLNLDASDALALALGFVRMGKVQRSFREKQTAHL